RYFLVTEPSYSELAGAGKEVETVVREGRVIAEKPRIVTPYYLTNMFEGFEHGKEYADFIMRRYGPNEPGLLYRYRNESGDVNIVSGNVDAVVERLNGVIDAENEHLSAIVKGVDEMWDVSLMKLVHDVARSSLRKNVMDLYQEGRLRVDTRGVPQDARNNIEEIFKRVGRGESEPSDLKSELDAWGLFSEYEDRFLRLFRKS
ncbi:MAG: hypothetical protein Q7T05_01915, partial [Dehalococcoidia bacterium]|nr:hypothetical protein [Dehalococcoidia bacterium]